MKYFIDTEFIEGFHKPLFGKKRHHIDLISIGIIAEDGREYYAISNEYKFKDADKWVQENVITPMYIDVVHGDNRNRWSVHNFHRVYGKSNEQIANEIKDFCNPELFLHNTAEPTLEFYGYYADYDWVLFCSLFGRMIDLPKGFPMYCRDLKQMLDEKAAIITEQELLKMRPDGLDKVIIKHGATLETKLRLVKESPEYPKQENEHNALSDAKWNKKLYDFIQTL